MQSIQLVGPYNAGSTKRVNLSSVYKILQIGVEHIHSTPIQEYQNSEIPFKITFTLRGPNDSSEVFQKQQYVVCDKDILEFEGLYQSQVDIGFPNGVDEYTIIDLAFKNINE